MADRRFSVEYICIPIHFVDIILYADCHEGIHGSSHTAASCASEEIIFTTYSKGPDGIFHKSLLIRHLNI